MTTAITTHVLSPVPPHHEEARDEKGEDEHERGRDGAPHEARRTHGHEQGLAEDGADGEALLVVRQEIHDEVDDAAQHELEPVVRKVEDLVALVRHRRRQVALHCSEQARSGD